MESSNLNIEGLKSEYITKRKQWFDARDTFSKNVADRTLPSHESDEYKKLGEDFDKLNGEVVDLMKKLEDSGVNIDELETKVHQERGYDFSNGCTLKANEDMAFLGVSKGDVIQLRNENGTLVVGPLSWSPEQLTEEINNNVWTLEKIG